MTWRVVGGVAVAALLGVALSAGGRVLERSPTFCVSCHEMERPGKGWKASGASEHHPDCIMCHSGPGPFGVLEAQTRGLGMLVQHFVESEEKLKGPFKAKVPDRFCTQCHEPVKIEAPHKKFSTAGKACRDCHKHREDWEFNGELRGSGESAGETDASITWEKD